MSRFSHPLGSSKKRNVSQKRAANNREQDYAERLGGYRQPNSGATAAAKGDIKLDDFLVDAKYTDKTAIMVDAGMLGKITHEARGHGKAPAILLELKTPAGCAKEWFCVPFDDFHQLLELVKELRNAKKANDTETARRNTQDSSSKESEARSSTGRVRKKRTRRKRPE